MNAPQYAGILRVWIAAAILTAALSTAATASSRCDRHPFGSEEWWFCMSENEGER
jgi:heme A synthase